MGFKISEIYFTECGPVSGKSWKGLETINLLLVYGKNESGKSFIIDLFINSLFKSKGEKEWGHFRSQVNGKVVLTDSSNDGHKRFVFDSRSRSRKKLEDYFSELSDSGLPVELARLLVVRAGEVQIIQDKHGLTIEFLKNLFSQKRILQKIGAIPDSIKDAEILDKEGRISIQSKTNIAKDYNDQFVKLKRLENLFQQVSEKYEIGELRTLQDKRKALEEKKAKQELARRHLAFLLDKEVKSNLKELDYFSSEEEMKEIKHQIEEFKQKNRDKIQLSRQIKKLADELAMRGKIEQEIDLQEKARRYKAQALFSEKKQKQEELKEIEENKSKLEELYKKYREKILFKKQLGQDVETQRDLAEKYQWFRVAKENSLKLKEAANKP
ncbi:MAG: hypothetical protein NC830_07250, partial [Candidatus Omnitrophica bacterium]|nr:hypothetical protein [Candidatus Omnitrophota bacterium]